MPTPLFRLDLTRQLDPVLQLARARPERVQLVAWAVRYLVENTDGLDVVVVEVVVVVVVFLVVAVVVVVVVVVVVEVVVVVVVVADIVAMMIELPWPPFVVCLTTER